MSQQILLVSLSLDELHDIIDRSVKKALEELQIIKSVNKDIWMDIEQLRNYIPWHPAAQTVYQWTSKREIPYHKKGRQIMFLQSEIDAWMKEGKKSPRK